MKKVLTLIIFITITISICSAQTENKNIIKIFPTSVFFGKTTIGYERVINEKGSVTFNLGLPSGINALKLINIEESDEMNLLDAKLDGLLLMPGYRFNFSKKGSPLGFYIEPYLKYEKYNLNIEAESIDDENERFRTNMDGNFSGFGTGVQLGVQCFISDVVSIDWSFFGLEAKVGNADLLYTDLDGGMDIDELYTNLEENFPPDFPIIGKKIDFEKGSDFVKIKASNFVLPGFRFAFSIGIAF